MSRTALDLTVDEWQAYRPGAEVEQQQLSERWQRARNVARKAADLLRARFGASKAEVFGSLTCREWFTPWSDVDLAAWDIPPELLYRAVAAVAGLDPEFSIDLVDAEDCPTTMRKVIEREGMAL